MADRPALNWWNKAGIGAGALALSWLAVNGIGVALLAANGASEQAQDAWIYTAKSTDPVHVSLTRYASTHRSPQFRYGWTGLDGRRSPCAVRAVSSLDGEQYVLPLTHMYRNAHQPQWSCAFGPLVPADTSTINVPVSRIHPIKDTAR